ncbi:MAG: ATP-dependent helicase, partial [Bacteroidota bacterium]
QEFGVSDDLVAVQLVEALYREALGAAPSAAPSAPRAHREDEGQDKAVAHTDGPALILAGPGTGKTHTLVRHAVHALRSSGETGDNLLVLTFSNEAAEELRVRIGEELAKHSDLALERVSVFTFHGFGYYLVRLFHKQLGYETPPTVLDEAGQQEVFLEAFAISGADPIFSLKDPAGSAERAAEHVNYLKQRLWTADGVRALLDEQSADAGSPIDDHQQHALVELWDAYEARKKALGRVDFADLIALPIGLLSSDAEALGLVREQFHRALIDEYQDVSLATGELVRTICLDPDGTVVVPPWVVGDPLQGIYAFLGADVRNVTEFAETFGAKEIDLAQSYRSCRPVTDAVNQLAELVTGDPTSRALEPDPEVEPYSDRPIRLAAAPSDAAEHQGVADLVSEWLDDDGVRPEDIAVLARRNVDVREIAKALGKRGLATATSGIVTAEGAAGDLAAMLTLSDDPASAIPRLAFALGEPSTSAADRNDVVERALAHLGADRDLSTLSASGTDARQGLLAEIQAAKVTADAVVYSHDAFAAWVALLFESVPYLRRVLDARDKATDPAEEAEANLALVELATAFGHAAAYRFSHPKAPPREARLQFAAHFRRSLARSTPSAIAPRRTPGLVQVMTCHASKGLEFPLVVVAGQRLPGNTRGLAWLPRHPQDPISGQPSDIAQADALLFVGVSRAERAVVVSFARSATGSGRPSSLPRALKRWLEAEAVPLEDWPEVGDIEKEIVVGPVWGSPSGSPVRVRALAAPKESCAIRSYVQGGLGLSFPTPYPDLYGAFVGRMRRFVGRVVEASHGLVAPLDREAVMAMLSDEWPISGFEDHPIGAFYRDAAAQIAADLPGALDRSSLTLADRFAPLDLEAASAEYGTPLSSGLAAHFRDADGQPVGIVVYFGSLRGDLNAKKTGVKWGTPALLRDRVELALLRSFYESTVVGDFQAHVFSVEDGELYPFAWPAGQYFPKEVARIGGRLGTFARSEFQHVLNSGQCERCGVRIDCPFWIGASGSS